MRYSRSLGFGFRQGINRRHRGLFGVLATTAGFAILLATSPAVSASSLAAKPQSDPRVSAWQASSVEGARFLAAARFLEVYLVRNPDGTLSLDAPPTALAKVSDRYVQVLNAGLTVLNGKIRAGELQTTSSGAVFAPATDRLVVQDGWTGHGTAWWGNYYCFSHWDLVNLGNYPNWAYTGLALTVIAAIPGTNGLVAVFIALYLAWLVSADNGNGSCLNIAWGSFPTWVTSQ